MRPGIVTVLSGLLFGLGLSVSGMVDARIVLAFLTIGPGFDVRLLLVMAGALIIALPGFRWAMARGDSAVEITPDEPPRLRVDTALITGAALFGLGWGVGGYCPGPAVAGLMFNPAEIGPFLIAMISGWYGMDKWL